MTSTVEGTSKLLRVSTTGCQLGRMRLLIDDDQLGTVVSVEVDAEQLIGAMRDARNQHIRELERDRQVALVKRMTVGKRRKEWVGTHKIRAFANALPYQVNGYWVELLESYEELINGQPYQRVRVMFPNGYTVPLWEDQIVPLTEEDLS